MSEKSKPTRPPLDFEKLSAHAKQKIIINILRGQEIEHIFPWGQSRLYKLVEVEIYRKVARWLAIFTTRVEQLDPVNNIIRF